MNVCQFDYKGKNRAQVCYLRDGIMATTKHFLDAAGADDDDGVFLFRDPNLCASAFAGARNARISRVVPVVGMPVHMCFEMNGHACKLVGYVSKIDTDGQFAIQVPQTKAAGKSGALVTRAKGTVLGMVMGAEKATMHDATHSEIFWCNRILSKTIQTY